MLYNGFVLDLARRFQRSFEDMRPVHNFESGPEFEIAVCRVLREVLPGRAGICLGYVVSRDGAMAGDDIIIFDAARFPTLRCLGGNFERREHVPAEAVLAYIEAKHTLYIDDADAKEHKGQTLAKALKQVSAVKSLMRPPVPLSMAGPRSGNAGMTFSPPPGYPEFWNPWYAAIFAKNLKTTSLAPPFAMASQLEAATGTVTVLPDAIAAGDVVTLPCIVDPSDEGHTSLIPFLHGLAELTSFGTANIGLGVATLHLLTAIEWLELGQIPWGDMVAEALTEHGSGFKGTGARPIVSGTIGDGSGAGRAEDPKFTSWARLGLGLPKVGRR